MCGLAGFVNFSESSDLGNVHLMQTSKILSHRGPDDEGFLLISNEIQCFESYSDLFGRPENNADSKHIDSLNQPNWKVGFMYRRLAIIDPKPEGHQPFPDKTKQVWMVFNGEIYNYKSLRSQLKNLGYHFDTETDTEVLLQSYLHWGKNCVHHLDGMWSFAICDLRNQILFASVDQTGIKPFYFYSDANKFCFASEIKAFKAFNIPFQENQKTVSRFLTFGLSDETSETLFKNISRLKGGQSITIDLNSSNVQISDYHKYKINSGFDFRPHIKEKERIDVIQSLLVEMIGLRLQSDVPLGICLSGGIDSSTIAGLVSFADRHSKNAEIRKAFMATIQTGNEGDESHFARFVAKEKGFEFHNIQPDADAFVASLHDVIYTLDEPPPGLNAFSQYAVFQKVAEQNVTVTLDGQGADEIFAGYPRHQETHLYEGLMNGSVPMDSVSFLKGSGVNGIRSMLSADKAIELLKWQKPEFEMILSKTLERAGKKGNFYSSVNEGLISEFTSSSLPFLVKAADRNSMRWSIESRMPFADFQPLVEYLFQVPGSAKIQAGYTKYLLRKAAQPFVSQSILQRKDKVGFAAPNTEWMQGIPESLWEELLAEQNPIIDASQVRKWLKTKRKFDIFILWRIFSYLMWRRIFISSST